MKQADTVALKKMISYCDDIAEMLNQFGNSYETYLSNKTFQYASSMCILQIGELVNRVSEETLSENVQIPWHSIRAMRNVFAHSYERTDSELAWQTITQDIPTLKEQLQTILEKADSDEEKDRE